MIYQLRTYGLFEQNKNAFYARFRDHSSRIQRRLGFVLLAAWEAQTPQGAEFVYILEWPDETAMRDGWNAFTSDEEWTRIEQETNETYGPLVGQIQDTIMREIEFIQGRWQ